MVQLFLRKLNQRQMADRALRPVHARAPRLDPAQGRRRGRGRGGAGLGAPRGRGPDPRAAGSLPRGVDVGRGPRGALGAHGLPPRALPRDQRVVRDEQGARRGAGAHGGASATGEVV